MYSLSLIPLITSPSAIISRTVIRGLSDAIGSWKIICILVIRRVFLATLNSSLYFFFNSANFALSFPASAIAFLYLSFTSATSFFEYSLSQFLWSNTALFICALFSAIVLSSSALISAFFLLLASALEGFFLESSSNSLSSFLASAFAFSIASL